jgi:S-adenosylmethionine-diacylglycerol 3-amino-3-carboxypropyl transferase
MTPTTGSAPATTGGLLGSAVYRHRKFSRAGALERLFTFAFHSMVYPQIWEDPDIDIEALDIKSDSRLVAIASGGCNLLNYLPADPQRIFAVDLNPTHVALVRLKLTAIARCLDHASFFKLFGNANTVENVDAYDRLIAPHLDASTRSYWDGRDLTGRRRITRFQRSFYESGLLGRFIGTAHRLGRFLGTDPKLIMAAKTHAEQIALFDKHFKPLFESKLLRRISSHRASLFGLGIPPAQYDALCDHGRLTMADVLLERTRRLATGFDLKDNYFAWQAFGRRYPEDGQGPLPPYLQSANFETLKARAPRISVEQQSLITFLENQPAASLDRYVLLDAQDWMDDDTLNALWREITRTSRRHARVIFRTAGHDTILPGRVIDPVLSQWTYNRQQSEDFYHRDRSAIYGGFHLYIKAN